MGRGNPDFIAAGWGEATKAVKLPVRVAERIQELRDDGEDVDAILGLLERDSRTDSDFDIDEVVELLQESLQLKPNAGGAIKAKIRQVLDLLGADYE